MVLAMYHIPTRRLQPRTAAGARASAELLPFRALCTGGMIRGTLSSLISSVQSIACSSPFGGGLGPQLLNTRSAF